MDKSRAEQKILTARSWQQALTPNKGNYGFGWAIDSLNGRRYFAHTGSITNFSSLILYFPGEDICIILLNNKVEPLWNSGLDISQIIFNQTYQWGDKPEIKLDAPILNQYTGSYAYDKSHTIFVTVKDGKLLLSGTRNTGINNAPFVALNETDFYNIILHLKIEFEKDINGKVTGLKSIRDGWYLSWIKENQ